MKRKALTLITMSLITLLLVISIPSMKAATETPQIEWSKTYGTYDGHVVIQTADGGYAVAGVNATHTDRGYGDYAPLLIKINPSGEMDWGKTYSPEFGVSRTAYSVVQTKDLGYVLCGQGNWLLKVDSDGNVQWTRTFGKLQQCRVIQTSDGGYVVAGIEDVDNVDVTVIIKTDSSGNALWNKTFSGGSSDVDATAVVEADDGGYAVAGSWGRSVFWFAEIDSDGNLGFNQTYGFSSNGGYIHAVAKTNDGGYILAGWDDRPEESGNRAWLIKTDIHGNAQWNHHFENSSVSLAFSSVAQTEDGGYIAAGDGGLIKTDKSGVLQWSLNYFSLNSVTVTKDGGFAVAGYKLGTIGGSDYNVLLAKFAPEASPTFPTAGIVAAIIIVVIVAGLGLILLIYLTKSK